MYTEVRLEVRVNIEGEVDLTSSLPIMAGGFHFSPRLVMNSGQLPNEGFLYLAVAAKDPDEIFQYLDAKVAPRVYPEDHVYMEMLGWTRHEESEEPSIIRFNPHERRFEWKRHSEMKWNYLEPEDEETAQ